MKIDVQPHPTEPGIKLLNLFGRLDTLTEPGISPQVLQALEDSESGLILDLAQLEFVSSAGLRLLLIASKNAAEKGKPLAMVRVKPAVYKIFKLSGFEGVFHVFQDEATALETLWKQA